MGSGGRVAVDALAVALGAIWWHRGASAAVLMIASPASSSVGTVSRCSRLRPRASAGMSCRKPMQRLAGSGAGWLTAGLDELLQRGLLPDPGIADPVAQQVRVKAGQRRRT
jgi:hypothetical protein